MQILLLLLLLLPIRISPQSRSHFRKCSSLPIRGPDGLVQRKNKGGGRRKISWLCPFNSFQWIKPGRYRTKLCVHRIRPGRYRTKLCVHRIRPGRYRTKLCVHRIRPGRYRTKLCVHRMFWFCNGFHVAIGTAWPAHISWGYNGNGKLIVYIAIIRCFQVILTGR